MFYPPFCLCNILSGDLRRAEPCLTAWTWQGGCCGASAVQGGYPYSWMVHVLEERICRALGGAGLGEVFPPSYIEQIFLIK